MLAETARRGWLGPPQRMTRKRWDGLATLLIGEARRASYNPRGPQTEPHWNLDDPVEDENPHKNAGFDQWAILGSNQ